MFFEAARDRSKEPKNPKVAEFWRCGRNTGRAGWFEEQIQSDYREQERFLGRHYSLATLAVDTTPLARQS